MQCIAMFTKHPFANLLFSENQNKNIFTEKLIVKSVKFHRPEEEYSHRSSTVDR